MRASPCDHLIAVSGVDDHLLCGNHGFAYSPGVHQNAAEIVIDTASFGNGSTRFEPPFVVPSGWEDHINGAGPIRILRVVPCAEGVEATMESLGPLTAYPSPETLRHAPGKAQGEGNLGLPTGSPGQASSELPSRSIGHAA